MRLSSLAAISISVFGATDPNYRALRDGVPSEALRTENVELKRDVATITLKNGQLAFFKPVLERYAVAVFTGEGSVRIKPAIPVEERYLNRAAGKPQFEENFESAVFFFSDETYGEVKKQVSAMPVDSRAANVLKSVRDKLKTDLNVDAEILGELYNSPRGNSFRAYFHGKHYGDLRCFTVPSGAIPDLRSPDETALINIDSEHSGIWYLSHLQSEWSEGTATSMEDKRDIRADHYKIDTEVDKGGALTAITEL